MCKLFSSYIFIVLPFRVEKRDCLHVKVLENFKCFCFNDKQKIITKGYEKSCKVGPNHAWYQSYLPNQFVGLQMASLEFLGFHVFPTLSPLCEVLWLGPDQQWSFGEPKRRWWSRLNKSLQQRAFDSELVAKEKTDIVEKMPKWERETNLELRMPWVSCQCKNHCLSSHLISIFGFSILVCWWLTVFPILCKLI